MNTAGLDTDSRAFFNGATILIAIPTGTKVFNWISASTLVGTHAQLIAIFLVIFTLGGSTGVILGSAAFDLAIHDTYYVVAHFHYILSIAAILGILLSVIGYEQDLLGCRVNGRYLMVGILGFSILVTAAMTPLH